MNEPDSPEYKWGRVNKPCTDCPTGKDKRGEPSCRHPWRLIIANCGRITEDTIAKCWDAGASIVPAEISTEVRPSVELFYEKPEELPGKNVFEIN